MIAEVKINGKPTALENDGNLFSLSDSLVYTKAKLLGVQKKETI